MNDFMDFINSMKGHVDGKAGLNSILAKLSRQ